MKELIVKYFPIPPATICDIGGGAGEYSFWLASIGYQVHLIDIVPLHIAQAKERSSLPGESFLSAIRVGNALSLDYEDNYFDAVFMGGPLYHLINKEDR
jgi:ubiquinone/menaquinone biosynthesis C-methylase UbiE